MNREQKAEFVKDIRARFESAPLIVLADYKGSTVAQMDQLLGVPVHEVLDEGG